mgnify:FL=1
MERETIQTTLTGYTIGNNDCDAFGDAMGAKAPQTIRIAYANVGRLLRAPYNLKTYDMAHKILKWDVGVIGIVDICLNWSRIPKKESWHSHMRHILPRTASQLSHNTTEGGEEVDQIQYEGMGIILTREAVTRLVPFGFESDPT